MSKKLLYEYIRGSQLYGLATETSDVDKSGVYLQPINEILGLRENYKEQDNVDGNNDIVYYELGRFVELVIRGNPNMIESLFVPEDKMLVKPHEYLKPLFDNRDKLLTKELVKILTQYAHSQIGKARGLNKAIVNPIEDRKDVLDFCYTFHEQGSKPIKEFLKENGLYQEYCGLVNIAHMHNVYGVYYDFKKHFNEVFNRDVYNQFSLMTFLKMYYKSYKQDFTYNVESPHLLNRYFETSVKESNYRGIIQTIEVDGETYYVYDDGAKSQNRNESNEVRLSSVEKGILPICYMSYNKSGYSKHCVDYKNYQTWKKERNPERFKINTQSQKNYDVKNLSHCIRLLTMGCELVDGQGFLVDRTDIDRNFILSVKMGEWNYNDIMKIAEEKKKYVEDNIQTCSLPDKVDKNFFNKILIKIRKEFYSDENPNSGRSYIQF